MIYSLRGAKLLRYLLAITLCAVGTAVAQEGVSVAPPSLSAPPSSVPPSSAPPSSTLPSTPLRYRRVNVPQSDLDQFISGHLPLRRDEFPTLVEGVERQLLRARDKAAWIQSADYSAVFADRRLTAGLARLNVVHTATESSVLLLSPCQLAIGAASWQGAETATDAIIGNDLVGNLAVVVPASGQLQFPWTLRGATNEWGETSFLVVLAPAPMNRFTVELPAGYQLLADRGIVSQLDDTSNDSSNRVSTSPSTSRRWVIQLGGTHRFRFTVASDEAMRQRKQLVSLQQDTRYRLADDGLQVDCNVELDIQREPLEALLFRVDPELQVTSVRLGNREVAWSLDGEQKGRSRQLQIRFAEPLSGIHRTLQLTAVGPLQTGKMWRLPRFHPQDTFWRQGSMNLVLPESLSLLHLVTQQAQQSETSASEAASPLAASRFELFSREGLLEVHVVRTVHKMSGIVGTTIDLEPGAMSAQMVADLSCKSGQHYVLEADVPNSWTLEGIESEPADFLDDHQFIAYGTGTRRLQIRLAQPLTADRSLRLTIRAHRTPTLELSAEDFRPLRLGNLSQTTRWVAIAPDPSYQLNLAGDVGVERLDPESLPPAYAELLQPRAGGIVFRDDQHADAMTVQVTREDPVYSAENHVLVEITADSLTESYRLICTPESTSVNRLLILLSEPRDEPIRWSLAADGNTLLSATKLDEPAGQPTRYSQTGEVWELLLRNPQNKPFEITGVRNSPFHAARKISLATLPDATSQEGWLSITSLDGTTMSLKANSVKPIPSIPREPENCSAPRARYRYDVSRNAQVLIDHVQLRTAQAALWAWHCLLRTQLLANGESIHRATYFLESAGGSEFQFRLPPDCALLNVDVDGSHLTRPVHTQANRSYTVSLPPNVRFPRVAVAYAAPQQDFRLYAQVAGHIPDVDIPVLDQQWTLWLAPGLEPVAQQTSAQQAARATWSQRLLGSFAADSSESPFRLLSADDWASFSHRSAGTLPVNVYAQQFLQSLGERYLALKTQTSNNTVTWRALLESYVQRRDQRRNASQVLIDTGSLADCGFDLDQPIGDPKTGPPLQVAGEILADNHLMTISRNDIVLLTRVDSLASMPDSVQLTENPVVRAVRNGSPLAGDLEHLQQWPLSNIIPLQAWIAKPVVAQIPWKGPRDISRHGVSGGYWRACQIDLDADGTGSLTVLRKSTLRAFGWALLLISTGLIVWLGSYRPRTLVPLIVGTAFLAMVVPSTWIPVTSNLFLGTLLASAVLALRRLVSVGQAPNESSDPERAPKNVAITVGVAILAALLVLSTRSLPANELPQSGTQSSGTQSSGTQSSGTQSSGTQSSGTQSSGTQSSFTPLDDANVYRVIVPVDEDLKPTGEYDYLPAEFYDTLRRRGSESAASAKNWLVRGATYRAVFNWTRQRSSLDLTSFTATYQLELFRPLQRIEFPWDGNDSAVQILEARLASQPIELRWNRDRTAFFVTASNEGITQLEFVLLPATTEQAGSRNLKFPVPPLSRAQLHIETPFDAPEVEVLSAVGEASIVAETGERLVELGPVRSLALRWASGLGNGLENQQLEIQQLSWIKVRPKLHPDSVILDATFRIQSSGGRIEQLSIQTDPRLRLLPVAADQGIEIDESGLRNGNKAPLVVRLREPAGQNCTLRLQFWVMNTSGLGNLSLPHLEVVNGRTERRWLAVSVASDLDFSAGLSDMLTPMDAAEFLAGWGEAELAPSLCYRMDADDPTWSISTRSRQPQSEAWQQLDVSVGPASMQMVFQADVNTTNGTVFQHVASVPRGFRVTGVRITRLGEWPSTASEETAPEDQELIPAEAEHDGSGVLTIFVSQGVAGPHRVELRGELEVPAINTDIPAPEITLQGTTIAGNLVRFYRRVNVLVSVKNALQGDRTSLGEFRKGFGRLVAELDADQIGVNQEETVTIEVRPNQPIIRARLVTILRRVDDTWEAVARYDARVTNAPAGVADQLRFEIPEEWAEPFTIEPDMAYEIRPIPGKRRHLILRPTPSQLARQRFQVDIRGVLALKANERGRTPNIIPLDVAQAERFFVLPTQLDQQRIDWKTSGLRLVSLQEAVPDGSGDAQAQVAYAVYARPRAVIADVQRVAGERQIGLADVHVMCQPDGSCFGSVAFDIEPAGMGSCTLEVPGDCELIEATVEGVPATLVPLADRRWHLRLASEQLPQQLAVLFRTRLPAPLSVTAQPVQVPWITDFDVVRTLWTVHGPRLLDLQNESQEQHRVSAVAQEAIRLRSTASLVESAVETVLDSPATEIKAWYTPWAVRLACSEARLTRERLRVSSPSPLNFDAVEALKRQQTIIGQRLNVPSTVEDFRQQTSRYSQTNDMLRFMQRNGTMAQHYAFIGKAPAISVARRAAGLSNGWRQALGAALIAVLGGLFWLGTRHDPVVTWLCQWPYAIGVLIGLAWWLFASPSLLGWVIIALSLWGSLRLPMPSRSVGPPSADLPSELTG